MSTSGKSFEELPDDGKETTGYWKRLRMCRKTRLGNEGRVEGIMDSHLEDRGDSRRLHILIDLRSAVKKRAELAQDRTKLRAVRSSSLLSPPAVRKRPEV